ncbi:MAG: thermonuclease family protein [Candidatus Moraniibacteriota bacterium]|jgi:micrococcal nuclease
MQKKQKYIAILVSCAMLLIAVFFDLEDEIGGIIDVGQKHEVTYVVDGDTFDIDTGERIRMIGMDTPERGEPYYKEATDRLKELIEGKEVVLKKDISETDRYDRLLRHVYVGDDWINKIMIDEGYARFVTFPPDVYHVDIFKEAQRDARKNNAGLWMKK